MMKLRDAQRLGVMLHDLGFTPIVQEMGDGYIVKMILNNEMVGVFLRIANRLAIIKKK